jgi:hypothetical protein
MKSVLISSVVFEMLSVIAKKKRTKPNLVLESLVKNEYLKNH